MATVGDVELNSLLSLYQKLLMWKGKRLDEYYEDSYQLIKDPDETNPEEEYTEEDEKEKVEN